MDKEISDRLLVYVIPWLETKETYMIHLMKFLTHAIN